MTVSVSELVVIGDKHHTDRPDQEFQFVSSGPRFYSEALTDLQEGVDYAEANDVDAVIQMGDQIDSADTKSRMTLADEVQAILHSTDIPAYNVMGNWDNTNPSVDPLQFDDSTEYFEHIKNGAATYDSNAVEYVDSDANEIKRYYTFTFGSALGIVLDNTGSSPDDFPSNEYYRGDADLGVKVIASYYIRQTQLTWLTATLAANTTVPIVIFAHNWLGGLKTTDNPFGFVFHVSNRNEVESILATHQALHGNIAGVFGGHHHPGGREWWDDKDTTPPSIIGAVFHEAYRPLMETGYWNAGNSTYIQDGIKYFRLAAPIRGWGSELGGVDEAASNIFYHIKVGRFVTDGDIDIRVTGIGVNPTGDSKESTRYVVL